MNFGIAFTPLVPTYVLWGALALTVVLALMLLLARSRGAAVRMALAMVLFALALANPSLTREDREPRLELGRRCDYRQEPEPGAGRSHAADRGGTR